MINVNKPFLPPISEFNNYLETIWNNNWLTNRGPLVQKFEDLYKSNYGLKNLLFVNNGTIALQLALKALNISKEVITTPFSYVATTNAILWEKCTPVYCDINPETFNIDENKIEEKITPNTECILATHVFGTPCNVKELERIAKKHDIKLIFDAAHCHGTLYNSESILLSGDISTISFHATKLFHTIEGGGLIANNTQIHDKLVALHNFGHLTPHSFNCSGINGKVSEFHAAMGLSNFKYDEIIKEKRNRQWSKYYDGLQHVKSLKFQCVSSEEFKVNHAYFPIIFKDEIELLKIVDVLAKYHIYPRRYFSPSLNLLSYLPKEAKTNCQISESISQRVLCLPLYYTLDCNSQDLIIKLITEAID